MFIMTPHVDKAMRCTGVLSESMKSPGPRTTPPLSNVCADYGGVPLHRCISPLGEAYSFGEASAHQLHEWLVSFREDLSHGGAVSWASIPDLTISVYAGYHVMDELTPLI